MNPIRTIRRLACTLTGLAVTLAAAVAVAPAAFAGTRVHPPTVPPAAVVRFGPLAHAFSGGGTGDMTGYLITLIAVGAALVGAALGVLVDRARATRVHRPATAA